MTRLLALSTLLLATVAASCASAATHAGGRCTGANLSASFKAVPGSEGAGNIVYALRLTNTGTSTCTLTGLPAGKLIGKTGKVLPTKIVPAFKGALTAILVRLAPGKATTATARFSPDVPGPGEGGSRQCEPVAYWFAVGAQGGGTVKAKITPPTSVCEHGQLQFTAYGQPRD